jgi:hypothetical protein
LSELQAVLEMMRNNPKDKIFKDNNKENYYLFIKYTYFSGGLLFITERRK